MANKKDTPLETVPPPSTLPWDQEFMADSLQQTYQYTVQNAQDQIDYYNKQSRPKKRWARSLRVLAIISTALAGIIPIFSQISIATFTVGDFIQPVWASVAVALAATFLGLDRFFGFSSAWMRFISSELELRHKLQAFQYEWTYQKVQWQGQPPTVKQTQEMVLRCAAFDNEVAKIVQKETESWMEEFQNILKRLDQTAKTQAQSSQDATLKQLVSQTVVSKPGAINVYVENGDQCQGGWGLIVDEQDPQLCNSKSGAVNNIPAGLHQLRVKGKIADKFVYAGSVVEVLPGEIAKVELTLN